MNTRHFLRTAAAGALAVTAPHLFAQAAAATPAPPKPGPVQTLTSTNSEGKPVMLDNFAGKVCLVSFFTAGCNLCVNELKLMREFYTDNKKRDFVLLGVNMDEKKADFMQYVDLLAVSIPAEQRFPLAWRHAAGHRDSFGTISRKPTHFVLDRQHRQVLRREGNFLPTDWDDLWTSLA